MIRQAVWFGANALRIIFLVWGNNKHLIGDGPENLRVP
jgi:hypothetical protein